MPTVMLTGAAPAHLPARPITLIVERDNPGDPVELIVDPPVQTVRPKAGMLVVPMVSQALTVSVRPAAGATFPTPTVLHLSAIVTVPGSDDHDRVVVPSVQVSGLPGMELLQLVPGAGQVMLSRPAVTKESVLTALGDAALVASRALIGSPHMPEDRRVGMKLIIDGSVSMITPIRNGAVSAAVDLLTGIAAATARGGRASAVLSGQSPQSLVAEPSRLSAEIDAMLTGVAMTTGFSAGVARGGAGEVNYVVTDSIPADHDLLDSSQHVVLLASRDAESLARSLCAVPLTVVDAGPGSSADLLADRGLLERTVASLLTAVGVGDAR